ncbi:hypothetical protein [Bifidobacterium vansinderenii]|uniref:hypothetical protein n=1 Tax=Bifidobacterium vansinderenii TaxID=1984871 RepID=UPI0011774EC3|nr:hypothetical protein [Bifidobacterium vansinderenii]
MKNTTIKAIARGMKRGLSIATQPNPTTEFQRIRRNILETNTMKAASMSVQTAMIHSMQRMAKRG